MTATRTIRTTETTFREALEADPSDVVTRLILADWLEERGRDVEANGQRWQARNRQWPQWWEKCENAEEWDWWHSPGCFAEDAWADGRFEASLPFDIWKALPDWA